ncbi:hypothetical protein [Streptomyces sasae]|nr:hypothetical protein [Streptomyces sasae]
MRDAVLAVVAARQRGLVTMFMLDEVGTLEPFAGRVLVVKL